ncbi:MAG: phosphohistidine phosphatase [Streptosporangiaceae bacterium]|nr:phosphohistidine phosphatase [Streptosporangiaceae bacterium]
MTTAGRTLLVLRHGKSAYPEGTADFERPLAPRGLRDAVALGTWIRDQGLLPDLVVCSAAARARQTWDVVSDQLVWADEDGGVVRYDPGLYQADPGDLISIIKETPPEVAILALVGHNPAVADLVHILAGDHGLAGNHGLAGDHGRAGDTGLSFPTSALAVIGVRRGWDGAAPGSGSLDGYWTPKGGSVVPLA